jgi:hypothetical protein
MKQKLNWDIHKINGTEINYLIIQQHRVDQIINSKKFVQNLTVFEISKWIEQKWTKILLNDSIWEFKI